MSFHHEFGVELRDQWKDSVHVLDSVVQGSEGSPVLDFFVLLGSWVALFGLHVFDQLHEVFSVDLIPKSFLPVIELILNQGDHIPHVFQLDQFISAVFKLLV
jgi:hypothetical protein